MAGHDFAQISTVLHRLEQLSQLAFNPLHLAEAIAGVISATADPPPGKPKELMQLAAAYRKAAMDTVPMVVDIADLASGNLPEVWKGEVAVTAAEVVGSTGDLVSAIEPAFVNAATAIEAYAGTLDGLQKRHGDLYQRLHDAMHSIGHIDIGGVDLPFPDPADLVKWCAAVYSLITGCVGVYNDCLNAADELIGQLAYVRSQARTAVPVHNGMPAFEAVVLADLGFDGAKGADGYGILSASQLAGLPELLGKLSPADRAALDRALAKAGSPLEEAYLLKALAAGHDVAEISGFAGLIRGKPDDWPAGHLALFDPGAPTTDGEGNVVYTDPGGTMTPIKQMDSTSCGATAIVVARAMNDPLYTLGLTTDGKGKDLSGADFANRLAAEEKTTHNATNTLWPKMAGTTPFGETAGMNAQSGEFGANYTTRMVDDTDPRSVGPALRDAISAVDAGHPVPVMLTPTPSQLMHGGEFHWVTLIGHQDNLLTFYNPGGSIVTIPESDFLNGQMQSLDHGTTHVNAISVPG